MKTGQRLALGISLGAFFGAALAAGIIHALPVDGNLQSGSAELLIYSLQLAFGHLADNPDRFLIGCGALIGAVTGVLLAKVVPHAKICVGIFLGLIVGIAIGGAALFRGGNKGMEKVSAVWESSGAAQRAFAALHCLKYADSGTTNDVEKIQHWGRSELEGYVNTVEQWKKHGRELDSFARDTYQDAWQYLHPFSFAEKREEDFFWRQMLPLAKEFAARNGLATADFGTNNISHYRIEFFDDGRAGSMASLKLKSGCSFDFISNGKNTEVNCFRDGKTKTSFSLLDAPKEKIEAAKALNLQNKLNEESGLALAKKYFQQTGHNEKDFHPPEFLQCTWYGDPGGKLPYYEIIWHRNDVTPKQLEEHDSSAESKTVVIEVSGIDSSLISYFKGSLPIGGDF